MSEGAARTLDAVFVGHRGALVRLLARIVGSVTTAEDLVQEAYLRVSAAIRERPVEQLEPFLFQTARNLAFDHLRQEQRRRLVVVPDIDSDGMEAVPAARPSPETEVADRQLLARLEEALGRLTERQRRIVLLNRMEGLSHAAIADRLGVSVSTVQKELKIALLACLEIFARLNGQRLRNSGRPDVF